MLLLSLCDIIFCLIRLLSQFIVHINRCLNVGQNMVNFTLYIFHSVSHSSGRVFYILGNIFSFTIIHHLLLVCFASPIWQLCFFSLQGIGPDLYLLF